MVESLVMSHLLFDVAKGINFSVNICHLLLRCRIPPLKVFLNGHDLYCAGV